MKITREDVEKFMNAEVDVSGLSESELESLQNAVAFVSALGQYIDEKGDIV